MQLISNIVKTLMLSVFITVSLASFGQLNTVTTGDTNLCVSAAVQLLTVPSGGTSYSYSWTPSTGLSSTSIANPVATPTVTTSYIVTVTDIPTSSTVKDTVVVGVMNIPPPVEALPVADTICSGDTVQFNVVNSANCGSFVGSCLGTSATSVVGSGTFSGSSQLDNPFFQVNFAPFLVVSSNKRQLIYTKAELNAVGIYGPTNLSALAFNMNVFTSATFSNFRINIGCTSSSSASTTFITGLSNVYTPKSVTIASSGWNEFSFDEIYSWDGQNNLVIELCYANSSAGNSSNGILFEILSANMGSFVVGSSNVCSNTTGSLTNRRPNTRFKFCDLAHTSAITYNWAPSTGLSSNSIRKPFAYPAASTNYILTATDVRGCYRKDTVNLTVAPNFNLSVNNDTFLCIADTLAIMGSGNMGAGAKYKWTSSSTILNDTIQSTSGYFSSSSTVYLDVTSAAGCAKRDSFDVTLSAPVDVEILTPDTTICVGDSIPIILASNAPNCVASPNLTCINPSNLTFTGTSAFPSGGVTVSPFDGVFSAANPGQKKQYLFLASELSAISTSRAISSIGFNILTNSTSSNVRNGFTIKMGCTSTSAFTVFPLSNYETGLQTVFTPKNINISTGWNDLAFDNIFAWDGVSNVIVEICWENSSSLGTGFTQMDWSFTSFSSTIFSWTNGSFCSQTTPNSATSIRPELRFGYCQKVVNPTYKYQWTPSAGLSYDTVIKPNAAPSVTTSYIVEVTDSATGCFDRDTIQITTAPAFNLVASPDSVLCEIDSIQLNASHNSTFPVTYKWTPTNEVSDSSIFNPFCYIDDYKTFVAEVTSNQGCIRWDTINLGLKDQLDLFLSASSLKKCEGDTINMKSDPTLACGKSRSALCNPLISTTIGTSTSTSNQFNITPFVATDLSSKKQYLIKLSELNSAGFTTSGQIGSISFDVSTLGKSDFQNFRIRMGCTSNNQLSSNFSGGMQIVLQPQDINLVQGINWFDLDNRFNWDGTSNIVIEVCYNNSAVGVSSDVVYSQPSPSFNCTMYNRGNSVCGSSTGTSYNRRPNIGLKYCNYTPSGLIYDWQPNVDFNNPSVQNPIATADVPGIYTLVVTDPTSNCDISDSLEINVVSINVETLDDTSLCSTEDFQLDVITDAGMPSYQWQPAADVSNDVIKNPLIINNNGTQFIITVTDTSGCSNSDTVDFTLLPSPVVTISPDIDACRDADVQLIGGGGGTYLWSPSKGLSDPNLATPVANVNSTTTYYLEVENAIGCKAKDSVTITIYPSPILNLGPDTSFCVGGSLPLNAGGLFVNYLWNNNSTDSILSITKSGTYWVRVDDQYNCVFTDTLNVEIERAIITLIDLATDICVGDSAILDAGNSGAKFIWNTGETTQQITVKDSGFYKVEIDNGNCTGSDSTYVSILEYPKSELPEEVVYCEKEFPFGIELKAGSDRYRYKWDNGQVLNSIIVDEERVYSVEIINGTQCSLQEFVNVKHLCYELIFVPNAFTPNGDSKNDVLEIVAQNLDEFEFRLFNRWGEQVYFTKYAEFSWDGTSGGEPVPDGVYVWKMYYKLRELDGTLSERYRSGSLTILR